MTSRSLRRMASESRTYMKKYSAMALNMNMVAYQRFSRKPNVRPSRSIRFEDIADSPDCVDQLPAPVNFVPEPADEHVHDIRLRIEAVVPDVFENHGLGHDAPGVAHEIFQKRELAGLKLDFFSTAPHFPGKQIQREIPHRQPRRLAGVRGAADECLDARQQFGKCKRLGQVIVAAGLKTLDAVI